MVQFSLIYWFIPVLWLQNEAKTAECWPNPRGSYRPTIWESTVIIWQNPAVNGCQPIVKRPLKSSTRNWGNLEGKNPWKYLGGVKQIHSARIRSGCNSLQRATYKHCLRVRISSLVFVECVLINNSSAEPAKRCQNFWIACMWSANRPTTERTTIFVGYHPVGFQCIG